MVNLSNKGFVVVLRLFLTVSVIIERRLNSVLDLLELVDNLSEFFGVELGGQLDQSLDGVASGDSAQSSFDFLLGNF